MRPVLMLPFGLIKSVFMNQDDTFDPSWLRIAFCDNYCQNY